MIITQKMLVGRQTAGFLSVYQSKGQTGFSCGVNDVFGYDYCAPQRLVRIANVRALKILSTMKI